MDWTLSGEAKRYIENSVIADTSACNKNTNVEAIDAIVDKLGRRSEGDRGFAGY